jgi:hypothetical protein
MKKNGCWFHPTVVYGSILGNKDFGLKSSNEVLFSS